MKKSAALILLSFTASALTLVDHGKSPYTIVLSAQASPSEHRAAHELQRFLDEMSGAKLPILTDEQPRKGNLILLGDNTQLRKLKVQIDFDQLGPEGFVLQTAGPHLIIAGGRQRGTMYGVYTFLDKLGCRWFTAEVSRIPKQPTIQLPTLKETHRPAFEYREPFFTEAWDKDWAARNRTNGAHSQLDASTGGKLQYYPFVHSFYELLPPETYFKDHPEYFSLIDGKRRTERGQLCLTNAAVLKIAIAKVESWIREHPDATIFSVSQNDWEGWCECDQCRRVETEEGGQHSGPLLRFVNAVANEIGQRHPGKLIDTLAYWYTENPPLHVRPAPNVRIRLCPIGTCVAHSFAQCPRSEYFYRNLQSWSKITNQLYIWHYNTNFSHYLMPFPDFDELAADIPLYKKHGVVGLFLQGAYGKGVAGENSELRAYVLARQLWDPAINVDKTVDEFLQGVYGPAAKPLRDYFDLLHSEVRPPADRHLWIFNVPEYSSEFRTKARQLFDQAVSLAQDEPTRRRVLKARLPLEYYALLRDTEFQLRDDVYGPSDVSRLASRARDLFVRLRAFGMESIHEGQDLSHDEQRYAVMQGAPAITLQNATWQAVIVPALNARVIRLIEKSTGRDALRRFPPGEGGYPNLGGQLATLHADYYAKACEVQWKVEQQSAQDLTLSAQCENGVQLRRQFQLSSSGLQTETKATNTGVAPVPVALQLRAEFSTPVIDNSAMSFQRLNGETVDSKFVVEGAEPTGKITWTGPQRPSSLWRLRDPGSVLSVHFQDAQVDRIYLNWTAKSTSGVTFGLWSPERTLAPGESIQIEAGYTTLTRAPGN
jgi:hypothetical protein